MDTHRNALERWHNHLKPDIYKTPWSEHEDNVIIEAHATWGNQWSNIAKLLLGKTDNAIEIHWNSTIRRRVDGEGSRKKSGFFYVSVVVVRLSSSSRWVWRKRMGYCILT